jgi:tetratricopeptide (TPR) repeat protein
LSDEQAIALYYSNLGGERLLDDEPEKAMIFFEMALETETELSEIWVNLGVARRRAGDYTGAESAYLRALESDPDDTRAYLNLASLMWRLGRQDATKELLSLLAQEKPRDPYAYLVLGDHALRSQRLEDAEKFYRRAIRKDRSSAEARAALGLVLLKMGETKQAGKRLQQAQKRDGEERRTQELARRMEPRVD